MIIHRPSTRMSSRCDYGVTLSLFLDTISLPSTYNYMDIRMWFEATVQRNVLRLIIRHVKSLYSYPKRV